jgi:hypothetical protein
MDACEMMANFGLFTLVENVSCPVITIIDHADSDIAVLCLYRQEKYDLDCHWPLLTGASISLYCFTYVSSYLNLVQFLLNQ